jgi:hypothetical protein
VNQTDTALDWFEQFQNSRDPQDQYWFSLGRDLRLPGMPNDVGSSEPPAYPFRPLSYHEQGATSVKHTILRDLPADSAATTKRHLFELGTQVEHDTGSIDPALRQQVLAKLWNNTTVRSHSFVVFVSAKLFRAAVDPANGAVRIGGPLKEYTVGTEERPELPEYRGVFLVDRSRLEQGAAAGGNGISDFRPFVVHRQILKQE